ncbi:hypothetical protein BDW42DRAFT_81464 [Aspergillus taichungensis]|uniref:RmlC-like cupin domain-containing protein n=1 Tax=Aspergillus taichungensis TaxID=482145 RepID=A0A2J5HY17_9EURO|nr:hypothetical protein BDW42DRAFT_81464 [Aspergillus taichungensis]
MLHSVRRSKNPPPHLRYASPGWVEGRERMAETYPIGTRGECERLVRDWGFKNVFTWSDGSNAHYPPHRHGGLTTHLIVRGSMTVTYPEDNASLHGGEVKKETHGVGARVDVPAGKLHEVWMGDDGCEYVIGE